MASGTKCISRSAGTVLQAGVIHLPRGVYQRLRAGASICQSVCQPDLIWWDRVLDITCGCSTATWQTAAGVLRLPVAWSQAWPAVNYHLAGVVTCEKVLEGDKDA